MSRATTFIYFFGGLLTIVSAYPSAIRNDVNASTETNGCGDPCNRTACPEVTNCAGDLPLVSDTCSCCMVCPSGLRPQKDVCKGVTCSRRKVCMLNIQGLPTCRCPSIFSCPKGGAIAQGKKSVCGDDGFTYRTTCHLAVAECLHSKKIRVKTQGQCPNSDATKNKSVTHTKRKRGKGRKKNGKKSTMQQKRQNPIRSKSRRKPHNSGNNKKHKKHSLAWRRKRGERRRRRRMQRRIKKRLNKSRDERGKQ